MTLSKHFTPICLLLLWLAAFDARADKLPLWEAGLGVAAIEFPYYRGSNERRTWILPAPYLIYRGKIFQSDEHRMRGLFLKTDNTEVELSMNGSVPVRDSVARRGMPDLYGTFEFGPSLNVFLNHSADGRLKFDLRMPLRTVFASDFHHLRQTGWLFQPYLNLDVKDAFGNNGWNLGILGGLIYSSKRYNQYFYGVDSMYATADRPAYDTGGGYAGTQFIAALSKRYPQYWVGGYVKWDSVSGAVFADSPLVTSRRTFTAGIAISWIIGTSTAIVEAAE